MINILESKIDRHIKFIDILFSQTTPISLNELATYFHVSESTILNDINYLNNTYPDYLFINKEQLKYIKLENSTSNSINLTQYLILNHSKNIQLLTELLLNPFKKIKEYSEILKLSSSYIYKAIDHINISLSPFNSSIKRVNNKYFIDTQSEVLLRKLFAIFLVETKSYTLEEIFNQQPELQKFKTEFTSDFFLNVKIFQIYYFAYFYLSTIREKQGFSLSDKELLNQLDDKTLQDLQTQQIIESLTYSPFNRKIFFYNRNFYHLEQYLINLSSNQKNTNFLLQFIYRIYENEISFQIPPSLFINKLFSFFTTLKAKKNFYQPIQKILNDVSSILQFDIKKYEIILSYMIMVHFPEMLILNNQRTIFIYSKLSYSHSEFLRSYFTSKFESNYTFCIVTDLDVINTDDKFSIFITTDPYLTPKNKVIINDYPTKNDIKQLKQLINTIYQ